MGVANATEGHPQFSHDSHYMHIAAQNRSHVKKNFEFYPAVRSEAWRMLKYASPRVFPPGRESSKLAVVQIVDDNVNNRRMHEIQLQKPMPPAPQQANYMEVMKHHGLFKAANLLYLANSVIYMYIVGLFRNCEFFSQSSFGPYSDQQATYRNQHTAITAAALAFNLALVAFFIVSSIPLLLKYRANFIHVVLATCAFGVAVATLALYVDRRQQFVCGQENDRMAPAIIGVGSSVLALLLAAIDTYVVRQAMSPAVLAYMRHEGVFGSSPGPLTDASDGGRHSAAFEASISYRVEKLERELDYLKGEFGNVLARAPNLPKHEPGPLHITVAPNASDSRA